MDKGIQHGGCSGRDPNINSIFLTMIEPWVFDMDLDPNSSPRHANEPSNTEDDPDAPLLPSTSKNPTKQHCVRCAAVEFVQSETCIRQDFANYLDDNDPSGLHYL
jgi:hypothetical protein